MRWVPEDIVIIDTNIVSILSGRKVEDRDRREFYRSRLMDKDLRMSFVTVHEVMWGLSTDEVDPDHKAYIYEELRKYRIEYGSDAMISASVDLRNFSKMQMLSWQDLLIGSTGIGLGCPLATDDKNLAHAVANTGLTPVISRHLANH